MATTKETTPKTEKPKTTPAAPKKPASIYERLAIVRQAFRAQNVDQSGINKHGDYTYYELPDIVPTATTILSANRLVFIVNFPGDLAVGELIDIDDPSIKLTFILPFTLISEPAKFRMNEVQGVGAAATYYRRYLYFQMLDICNKDELDGTEVKPTIPTVPETKPTIPASPEKRAEIAKDIVDLEGPADELQIKALKTALKKLRELDPSKEEFIQSVAVKTQGFTEINRVKCDELLKAVQAKIKEVS